MEILATHAVEPDAWRCHNTANIPAGEAMAGWGNAAHNAARRSRQNVQPRPHTNLPCRAVTEREKNQLIDELSLKDQQLQQVDTISVNYIRQDNGAYPIWLRGECGYSAGTMPIQGQHLVAKTERQSTSNTRRDVVIEQPDGTSRYVMEILATHAVEPDAWRCYNTANIPAGEAMAGWGNAAHNAARRSRQNVQPRPHTNLPCRAVTEREKNQLIDELSLKDQQLQQVDTISVNYIRQDNGAYPIWLRGECGYSAGTMPIQGQHLVAKTERQSTSNTRRDVVIEQPDGTSRYVMEILVTHAVEPDAWRCYNTANIPAGEAMAGWGNAAHNAARRSRQNVQPRPHTNLPCRAVTEREKNQLIDELSLKDQQLQQVDTISVNYIRQDNGAYPIWLRGECGYSAGTMPIQGQHLVAKTERQSTSNTRRDVVIEQPDGTSRYVMEILATHAVEPDAWRCHNTANIPAGEAMAGWGNAAHNAARRSRQNVQPRPHTNLPCRAVTEREKNQLIDELSLKDQQLQQVDTISVNYIRQDNGAYPIWLRGECGYSAGTMPIQGQHLVAKTERQSTSNTRRDVVIEQPDGTSRYVMEILATHAVEPDAWRCYNTANIPAGEAMAGWGNAAHNAARRSRQNVQPRPHTNLPCRAVTEREKNQLIDELSLKDQQLQQVDTISVNYIRQDNGAYPIWLRGECGYSAGTMPIQGQHLVAKTERQSTSNTRRDVVIEQPDGTSRYVMEILATHAVEPDAWRCYNTANIPAGEAMAGWGNAAHNAARRSRQNVQPRPHTNLPCRAVTEREKNQLIDELSLKDQQLQQVDTISVNYIRQDNGAYPIWLRGECGYSAGTMPIQGQHLVAKTERQSTSNTRRDVVIEQPDGTSRYVMEILVTHAVEPDAWRCYNTANIPAGEAMAGWGNAAHNAARRSRQNVQPRPHTNLPCRAVTEREKNQLIDELSLKDQQLQQVDTISVNYIRQDNGAYPIWLRGECGYSAGTMPIQGQHLVAKTERQSTSNTRRDVVIEQPDGTSRYVMEILVTHAVEPDAWRCHNTANIPAGEAMAGWGNAAHNAARRSRQNVQPRPHTNLPCRAVTEREKNQLIDELSLKDQQLQQVDTISVNYIRQDNGAYPIWLRGECGYSAGTMPIQGQHLVAKTERQSTSNTRRDVVIEQPDGTSRYVMEILATHAVEPDAWRCHNTANIPAGEAMAGWGNAAHNAARRSRQNVQPRPHTNLPCRAVTEREKNQLIDELSLKDQQLQQVDTISVNYIRQDNGAYPIWLRGECGYSAGTMPIQGQHLVAKTERQSTSNTRRDVVIEQPDGTSRYVMEILATHAVEPDAWRCHNTANIPAGEAMAGWGNAAHNAARRSRQNVQPRPHTNLPCRAVTEREKNQLIDELSLKDQQLQQVDTISVNYIRQDNGAYPIWLRGECGYSAGTMPIQGQHLVAKTERQSTSNTRRDVVIEQPDGTSRYVMEILATHAVEPDAWRCYNTANIPAGEAMAGWGNAAHNAARRSRQNVQPRPHTNLPCRAVTEREKNQLIDELSLKDQQLQQVDTISVNYIRQDNGAYPIWLRGECGYSAGTMPIQGQHLVAKTERQSTSNTRRDVVIEQPDGTSRYVMEILATHAVEPDAWRCYNTANIPAGEAMAGWGNAAHNAARRSRQNVQPRPHTNLPCRAVTEREKNQLIDELSLKDQQLQQVDTIIAELQDRITQAKRNATRRHVQRNEAQSALQKSVMDNQTMRQAIDQAKQELKNIRQQIADEKSSAQPCNCDYDQLLNNIVHEQVDVNRRVLLSTANDVSRYCDFNPPAHHNRTADRSRFGSSKPLLEHQADDNSKPTYCHRITAHFCARNCGRIRPDTD